MFQRRHRGIALTAAGQSLRDLVEPWSEELARFRANYGTARLAPVTVSASVGVTALWLLPRLAAFNTAHPDIDLRIAAHNRVVDLDAEEIDLAIRYSRSGPGVLAGLPEERDLSYLEASLFCLLTHLEFREVVPTARYSAQLRFRDQFGARSSAAETHYAFDKAPSGA